MSHCLHVTYTSLVVLNQGRGAKLVSNFIKHTMTMRDPPNLRRHGLGLGVKKARKLGYRKKSSELVTKTVSGNSTVYGQRKGVPNGWSGYSITA